MSWRLARSLETLRAQIDARYPGRSTVSDGTIGDAAHRTRSSDHNPWYQGHIVTALDITHDPKAGVHIGKLTDELAASRDPRIKYIIANRLIMDSRPGFSPWQWVPYHGANPHTRHFHLSVVASPLADDPAPWRLPSLGGGGGAAPIGGGDDMTPEQARQLDAVYKGMFYGSKVRGKEYPGLLSIEAETQRRVTELAGRNAGLLAAVEQLAAGREVDLDAVRAAAEQGTRQALAEGTVDVDVTITGGGSDG